MFSAILSAIWNCFYSWNYESIGIYVCKSIHSILRVCIQLLQTMLRHTFPRNRASLPTSTCGARTPSVHLAREHLYHWAKDVRRAGSFEGRGKARGLNGAKTLRGGDYCLKASVLILSVGGTYVFIRKFTYGRAHREGALNLRPDLENPTYWNLIWGHLMQ